MEDTCRRRSGVALATLPAVWTAVALAAASLPFTGCGRDVSVVSGDARPMPVAPRPLPEPPPDAKANAIALQISPKPRDTNGNGYPDLIEVAAYLFAEPHPAPIFEEGAFVFTLYLDGQAGDADALPIAEWRIEGPALERAKVQRTIYGPAYTFSLSLLTTSGDTFPLMSADLVCRFEPADGRPHVERREVHKLQIGSGFTKRN